MSTEDIRREQATADEWEEWAQEQLRRLWDIHADEVPWNDAHVDNPGN